MAYRRKIPSYWQDDRYLHSKFKNVRRDSLSDPSRIELLRWRILLRLENVVRPRLNAAFNWIKEGGSAFVQQEEGLPYRYVYENGLRIDHHYWENKGESPLEQLAWEGELHAREQAVTPETLAAGKEYEDADAAFTTMLRRASFVSDLLEVSIRELKLLPHTDCQERAIVRINGRLYPFRVNQYYVQGLREDWPAPSDIIVDVKPPRLEDSLGLSRSAVVTRFGQPSATFVRRKRDIRPNIYVYGAIGLQFDKHEEVEKILDHKQVTRLLKTAK